MKRDSDIKGMKLRPLLYLGLIAFTKHGSGLGTS